MIHNQQPISPIGFLFLKLPPPPCAVLVVIIMITSNNYCHHPCITSFIFSVHLWDVIRREICRVGFDQPNPKPETRNRLWRLDFPRIGRNPKPETRNRLLKLVSNYETRNPKPETDSEDLLRMVEPEDFWQWSRWRRNAQCRLENVGQLQATLRDMRRCLWPIFV